MTRRRPAVLLALLLLFGVAGSASLWLPARNRAPAGGGPHGIDRSPVAVLTGQGDADPGDPAVDAEDAPALHPAELLVRVTRASDGAAAAGARVEVRDARGAWSGVADAAGEIPFAGLEAGPCSIRAAAEGCAEGRRTVVLVELRGTVAEFELFAAPAVEGRVVSSLDGIPVPGAVIHATPNPGPVTEPSSPPSAVADAAGNFRLRAGGVGQALTLAVRARGFVPSSTFLRLPTDENASVPVTIALDPTGALRGRVTLPDGKPCRDATVLVFPAGTMNRVRDAAVLRTLTDAAGDFRVEGLALGGIYLARADAPGFAPTAEREVYLPAGATEARADFALRPGGGIFVRWKVEPGNNRGTGSVILSAAGTTDMLALASGIGTVRFNEVAPGRYDLTLNLLNAWKKGKAEVVVVAGETVTVDIEPAALAEEDPAADAAIEGIVRDGSGGPVAGVRVGAVAAVPAPGPRLPPQSEGMVVPGRGNVRADSTARSGEDGRFRITGLREGAEYEVVATAPRHVSAMRVSARAPASGIAIVIAPLGRLKGRLVLPASAGRLVWWDLRIAGPAPEDPFRAVSTAAFATGEIDSGELAPGPCRISATAGEYLLPIREATVPSGETLDLGDLPMVLGAMLRGRAVDSAGTPLLGVIVLAEGPTGPRVVTAEDGRFAVGPVPEGTTVLTLGLAGEEPLRRTVAAANGADLGDIVVPREGRLVVRATTDGTRPWIGEVVVRGASPDSRVLMMGRTDHLGRFAFSCPAREYQIQIQGTSTPVTLVEGAETRVDIRVGK